MSRITSKKGRKKSKKSKKNKKIQKGGVLYPYPPGGKNKRKWKPSGLSGSFNHQVAAATSLTIPRIMRDHSRDARDCQSFIQANENDRGHVEFRMLMYDGQYYDTSNKNSGRLEFLIEGIIGANQNDFKQNKDDEWEFGGGNWNDPVDERIRGGILPKESGRYSAILISDDNNFRYNSGAPKIFGYIVATREENERNEPFIYFNYVELRGPKKNHRSTKDHRLSAQGLGLCQQMLSAMIAWFIKKGYFAFKIYNASTVAGGIPGRKCYLRAAMDNKLAIYAQKGDHEGWNYQATKICYTMSGGEVGEAGWATQMNNRTPLSQRLIDGPGGTDGTTGARLAGNDGNGMEQIMRKSPQDDNPSNDGIFTPTEEEQPQGETYYMVDPSILPGYFYCNARVCPNAYHNTHIYPVTRTTQGDGRFSGDRAVAIWRMYGITSCGRRGGDCGNCPFWPCYQLDYIYGLSPDYNTTLIRNISTDALRYLADTGVSAAAVSHTPHHSGKHEPRSGGGGKKKRNCRTKHRKWKKKKSHCRPRNNLTKKRKLKKIHLKKPERKIAG